MKPGSSNAKPGVILNWRKYSRRGLAIFIVMMLMLLILIAKWGSSFEYFIGHQPEYIFLITLDTTRADAIQYDETTSQNTPNLSGLARGGKFFNHAFCIIPITLPSHLSMFYSQRPNTLNVFNNSQVLRTAHPSLASLLKNKGYQTAAVISLGVLAREYGADKGFDVFLDKFSPRRWSKTAESVNQEIFPIISKMKGNKAFFWIHYSDPHAPYHPPGLESGGRFEVRFDKKRIFTTGLLGYPICKFRFRLKPGKHVLQFISHIPDTLQKDKNSMVDNLSFEELRIKPGNLNQGFKVVPPPTWVKKSNKTVSWFEAKENESEMGFINTTENDIFCDVQFCYKLNFKKEFNKALYFEEIHYMDSQIGELVAFLKRIGIYEESSFVIVGDHGEDLGEYRDFFGHVQFLNKVITKVPLILCGKGFKREPPRQELVSTLDIAPTILSLVAEDKPNYMLGKSLLDKRGNEKLLLETYGPDAEHDGFSIVDFPFQAIYYPARKDQMLEFFNLETDVFGSHPILPDQITPFHKLMFNSLLKSIRKISSVRHPIENHSKQTDEILQTLGYL